MRKFFIIFLLLMVFIFKPNTLYSSEMAFNVQNNKFGIHILEETDIENAAKLVNSSGGDWGYVTIVIRQDDMSKEKWQRIFNKMRRLHLMPIVRVATHQENGGWKEPSIDFIDNWVSFFDSLNWVVRNRYIIIGNEPNHSKEWGGNINPEAYSDYLLEFSKKLKTKNGDFFVISAGLDASAPNSKNSMDEVIFIRKMINQNKDVFNHIDGWSSHSYPNPDFSGSVSDTGRGSIRTYEWEFNLLKSMGVSHNFPVFITETGWEHKLENGNITNQEVMSNNFIKAFSDVWINENIVAVTPFILKYDNEPYNTFSWTKKDNTNYKHYEAVQSLKKQSGNPEQLNEGKILAVIIPQILSRRGSKAGVALIKNIGQSIWEGKKYFRIRQRGATIEIDSPIFRDIEPGETGLIFYKVLPY